MHIVFNMIQTAILYLRLSRFHFWLIILISLTSYWQPIQTQPYIK